MLTKSWPPFSAYDIAIEGQVRQSATARHATSALL